MENKRSIENKTERETETDRERKEETEGTKKREDRIIGAKRRIRPTHLVPCLLDRPSNVSANLFVRRKNFVEVRVQVDGTLRRVGKSKRANERMSEKAGVRERQTKTEGERQREGDCACPTWCFDR